MHFLRSSGVLLENSSPVDGSFAHDSSTLSETYSLHVGGCLLMDYDFKGFVIMLPALTGACCQSPAD